MPLPNHYRKELIINKKYYDRAVKEKMNRRNMLCFATYVKQLIKEDVMGRNNLKNKTIKGDDL